MSKRKKAHFSGVIGQPHIEGIMMRSGNKYAVVVRKADRVIETVVKDVENNPNKVVNLIPFVRGFFALIQSLIVGFESMEFAANVYSQDMHEPTGFDKILHKLFGKHSDMLISGITAVLSLVLFLCAFFGLPILVDIFLERYIINSSIISIAGIVVKFLVVIFYLFIISMTKEVRAAMAYHGAEHKCVNCIENGRKLTLKRAKESSRFQKRCASNFIWLTMILVVLFFVFVKIDPLPLRLLVRLVSIPVIASVAYEYLRLISKFDNIITRILGFPMIVLQVFTVREPDDEMIEVAIKSLEAVFDWKEFLVEEFPDYYSAYDFGLEKTEVKGKLSKLEQIKAAREDSKKYRAKHKEEKEEAKHVKELAREEAKHNKEEIKKNHKENLKSKRNNRVIEPVTDNIADILNTDDAQPVENIEETSQDILADIEAFENNIKAFEDAYAEEPIEYEEVYDSNDIYVENDEIYEEYSTSEYYSDDESEGTYEESYGEIIGGSYENEYYESKEELPEEEYYEAKVEEQSEDIVEEQPENDSDEEDVIECLEGETIEKLREEFIEEDTLDQDEMYIASDEEASITTEEEVYDEATEEDVEEANEDTLEEKYEETTDEETYEEITEEDVEEAYDETSEEKYEEVIDDEPYDEAIEEYTEETYEDTEEYEESYVETEEYVEDAYESNSEEYVDDEIPDEEYLEEGDDTVGKGILKPMDDYGFDPEDEEVPVDTMRFEPVDESLIENAEEDNEDGPMFSKDIISYPMPEKLSTFEVLPEGGIVSRIYNYEEEEIENVVEEESDDFDFDNIIDEDGRLTLKDTEAFNRKLDEEFEAIMRSLGLEDDI